MDRQNLNPAADVGDHSAPAPTMYANAARVSYTPYDFHITFSLLCPPHDQLASNPDLPTLEPNEVAEIVIPVAAVSSLADILRGELQQFTEKFGSPVPSMQQLTMAASGSSPGSGPFGTSAVDAPRSA